MVQKPNLKHLARLGQRGAYGQTLLALMHDCDNIYALSADLGNSSGLDRVRTSYPERYLNVGIAEQNLIGLASGLSTLNNNCFVSSFAPFISMRCCEQIRMNLSYMRSNVKLVALGSGISMGYLGNSHFGLEDIAIIDSLFEIPIFCPSDTTQLYSIVKFLARFDGPAYLRLTGTAATSRVIYSEVIEVGSGGSCTLRDGNDILLLSHGEITSSCIEAINELEMLTPYSFHHEDIYCIKPLGEKVCGLITSFNRIYVVEEHAKCGALYTMLCQRLCEMRYCPEITAISLPTNFLVSGSYSELKKHYGIDTSGIVAAVLNGLRQC